MAVRIVLTFSDQPQINDSVQFNSTIVETFKATRTQSGEVAIGADLSETIFNFQQAISSDFFGTFVIVSSIDGNSIQFDFPNEQPGFFDTEINSDVITFKEFNGYFPYYISEYDNKVDSFRLEILGKEWDFNEENITATGVLSYKDVDNILEPIRGAQLDITIDANIEKPFDLFLNIRENDFKAELYRNGNLIFQGFINPEGVQQDYTSINWKANLVAVDNLGSLKNIEHPYTNEVPSEFVMMDLALKKTGLDLPIAFYDDINQNVKNGSTTIPYLTKLEDPVNERLIEPDTFKNNNDRFANCQDVLLDILNKYNAIIVQQSISYINIDTGQEEFMLCWLFARVASMSRPISNLNSPYKIKKITGYTDDGNGVFFPDVLEYNYKFGIPFRRLGTDGFDTQFLPNDAIHKNKNQLIRQERALQAFRFIHEWISKGSISENFGYDLFEYIGNTTLQNYFFSFNASFLNQPTWKARGSISTFGVFDPTIDIESQPNNAFNKFMSLELPNDANQITLEGSGSYIVQGTPTIQINAGIQFQILYTDLNGNKYYLQQPPAGADGNYTLSQVFRPEATTFNDAFWIRPEDIEPTSVPPFPVEITILDISHIFFAIVTQESSVSADKLRHVLPSLPSNGGTIDIYFSPLYARDYLKTLVGTGSTDPTFADIPQGSADQINFILEEFKVKVSAPDELGKGNYYDAENAQDVSSKIGEPINIINADDKSDIFLNGIKRSYGNEVNYPYWTCFWNLEPTVVDILELMSIERVRLLSKSQNIFSGDIHGYLPYFSRLSNTAYPNDPDTGTVYMVFTKWIYDTADNTISAEMRECKLLSPSVNFEKSVIFEDEDKKLKQ